MAGFGFSALLTAVVVLGLALKAPPLQAVERAGIDFGMKVFVAFAPLLDSDLKEQRPGGYIFVDVDAEACEAFRPPGGCEADRPISTRLVRDFVRAASNSGASVVVLDVAPPADAKERIELGQDLAGYRTGPWLIAPILGRPAPSSQGLALSARHTDQLIPGWAAGRLRLAVMDTSTDPQGRDGVVRHYPIQARVTTEADESTVPAAPFLVARLTDPLKSAATDCAYYAVGCQTPGDPTPTARPPLLNRIFYSLPSLAQTGGAAGQHHADNYMGLYERYPASGLLQATPAAGSGQRFELRRELFEGKTVVLGSGLVSARDIHLSPLGPMTGSEILLNAIRSHRDFDRGPEKPEESHQPPGAYISIYLQKMAVAAPMMIPMSVMWALIFGVAQLTKGRILAIRVAGGTAAFLIFCTWTLALVCYEILSNAQHLRDAAPSGHAIDFLTPLFAQGLEAYTEAAKTISAAVEKATHRLYSLAHGQVVRLLGGSAGWRGRGDGTEAAHQSSHVPARGAGRGGPQRPRTGAKPRRRKGS